METQKECSNSYYKNLPKGWAEAPLKELGIICGGGTPSKSNREFWEKGDVPWLTPAEMSSIGTVHISDTGKKITRIGLVNSSAATIPSNSVIMSSRAPIGYLVINDIPMTTSQGCKSFSPFDSGAILPEYVYFFLKSAKERINENASGTTFKEISGKEFGELRLPIPPRNEQAKIVKRLSEVLEKIKAIQIAQDQYLAASKALKEKILTLAINGRLLKSENKPADDDDKNYYKNPTKWNSGKLDDAGVWTSGSTPPRGDASYYGGSIPWIKTGELNGGLVLSTSEKVTEKARKDCHLPFVDENSVLIAMYGATIGKLGIPTMRAVTNQACCSCTPNQSIDKWFLFYFLLANRQSIIKMGAGGAQPNISKEKITSYPFEYPDFRTQQIIVAHIKTLLFLLN